MASTASSCRPQRKRSGLALEGSCLRPWWHYRVIGLCPLSLLGPLPWRYPVSTCHTKCDLTALASCLLPPAPGHPCCYGDRRRCRPCLAGSGLFTSLPCACVWPADAVAQCGTPIPCGANADQEQMKDSTCLEKLCALVQM